MCASSVEGKGSVRGVKVMAVHERMGFFQSALLCMAAAPASARIFM
jgi:hypothetical protein